MSWISDLYQTYEANEDAVAKNLDSGQAVLLPISHSTQKAQIEITLDMEGNFLDAKQVPKDQAVTIIPVTEDSAARSSNPCAHPLEDKLEYLAGDYEKYTRINNEKKHALYLQELSGWCNSAFSLPQLHAIRTYVEKNSTLKDLINRGILTCDAETGNLLKDKIEGIAQGDCFVRFSIDSGLPGREDAVYKDKEIFDAYIAYYEQKKEGRDLCYVSGETVACSDKHGAKVRNAGDKAKLISANDGSGFTYRGRFSDARQAASVGYDVSQKAHSALRWLVQKQGFYIGEMAVVAWEISGKPIPRIEKSSMSIFGDECEEIENVTNETYARSLQKAVYGYQKELGENSQVVVLGVEAATTGRLSVCFYHKMIGSAFIENIRYWYEHSAWKVLVKDRKKEKHWFWFGGSPALRYMAETAFGNKNDKVLKSTMERLLPCIIDRRELPKDLVKAAVRRTANPNSFDTKAAHQQAVGIACAMIRKSRYDRKKEDWNMALDKTETDRSYLYGRLLGAAQKLEEVALFYANEKGRATAAERYMQQFERRPLQTWKIIESSLQPYKLRLKASGKTYYEKELQGIYDLFQEDDFSCRDRLSELYLLGYNCQLNSYKKEDE